MLILINVAIKYEGEKDRVDTPSEKLFLGTTDELNGG